MSHSPNQVLCSFCIYIVIVLYVYCTSISHSGANRWHTLGSGTVLHIAWGLSILYLCGQ
jgi:hypothetical protein